MRHAQNKTQRWYDPPRLWGEAVKKRVGAMSPTCRDVARLQSRLLDGSLALWERLGMNMHLLLCSRCRRYGRQIQFLHRALQHRDDGLVREDEIRLPAEVLQRMKDALRNGQTQATSDSE